MNNLIKLKSTIDIIKLREYYDLLVEEYTDYKWLVNEGENLKKTYGENSKFDGIYGWAIKSKSTENIKKKPAYHVIPKEYQGNISNETDLFFGIMKKLDEDFPYFYDHAILVHPPETFVELHQDTNLKIHIPIITNDQSFFLFENEEHNLKADGSMFFTNTYNMHGVINRGSSIRVHLIVKVPKEKLDECLSKEVHITL